MKTDYVEIVVSIVVVVISTVFCVGVFWIGVWAFYFFYTLLPWPWQ